MKAHRGSKGISLLLLFLFLALDRGRWSMTSPSCLKHGKETQRRLGEPQSQSRWVLKISHPPGFDPQTDGFLTDNCNFPFESQNNLEYKINFYF